MTTQIATEHLQSDALGTLLDGYRRLVAMSFESSSNRWAAIAWMNTATDFLQPFKRADIQANEQLDVLVGAIGDIALKLNEHLPDTSAAD